MTREEAARLIEYDVKSPRIQAVIKRYVDEPVPEKVLVVEGLLLETATQLYLEGVNAKQPITVRKAVDVAKDLFIEAWHCTWENGL